MKTCISCGGTKPFSEFYKRADSPDGYRGACKKCKVQQSTAYVAKNKEAVRQYLKQYHAAKVEANPNFYAEYYANNRERLSEHNRQNYTRHKDKRNASQKDWVAANPEKVRQYKNAWKQKNVGAVREHTVRRRLSTKQQTPAWADAERTKAYYDVCAFFNEVNGYTKYHVDHIIPLRGKRVSGLHVHTNLRVIPARENEIKNNRFEV